MAEVEINVEETPQEETPVEEAIEAEAEVAETLADTTVALAEGAIELSHQQTAAAELDAAERLRRFEEENASWRMNHETRMLSLETTLAESNAATAAALATIGSSLERLETARLSIQENTLHEETPTDDPSTRTEPHESAEEPAHQERARPKHVWR